MTERGRREYAEVMRQRYQQAAKRERGEILDEYCRVTRCHREAAIRRLGAQQPLQQQQDIYQWRLHVSLILNEAVERLGRMEATVGR